MRSNPVDAPSRSRRAPGSGDLQEASERLGFAAVATKARPPNLDIALKNVAAAVAAVARYAEQQATCLETQEPRAGSDAAEAGPWNLRHFAHALEAAAAACAAARDSVRP